MKVISDISINADLNVDSGTLFVDSANNRVGVNTLSPSTKLHIVGDFLLEDSSTNPLLYIKDNGNVMIGDSTDNGYKLDVNGSVNANGDFYYNGTQGWSGIINIDQSPLPPISIEVNGGIITNVT
jgi:hypothetical protein